MRFNRIPKPPEVVVENCRSGRRILMNRGMHATAIGAICAEWARVESLLALLFTMNIFGPSWAGGDELLGIETFERFNDIKQKRTVLLAAAKTRLSDSTYNELADLLHDLSDKIALDRNEIVHGRWMISDDYPDEALWARRISDHPRYRPYTYEGLIALLDTLTDFAAEFLALLEAKIEPELEEFFEKRVAEHSAAENIDKNR